MEDQNSEVTIKDKKKPKGERRGSSKQTIEDGPIEQESVRDEIKHFKQNLLKSVATSDQIICENENFNVARSRSRSASRAHEVTSRQDFFKDLDEDKLYELKEAFLLFDLDGDGYIDHHDLRGTLVSLGERVDDSAVRAMLNEASNPLDFDAFVTLLGYKTLELDSEETLVAALSRWDRDNSGYISEARIRQDLMSRGDKFTAKEADYALDDAPTIQRGGQTMIDYIRFCSQLCGLRKARRNDDSIAF